MDLVVSVERFPVPGETITGREFGTFPGGKGANQAVALGRLGADVFMVGKLGNDLYGRMYLDVLKTNNVQSGGNCH
jgi:ribokinase